MERFRRNHNRGRPYRGRKDNTKTQHLQDIRKGQGESGLAEMTEEGREETKASKPQELLSKEDQTLSNSSIRVVRCKDYR